MAIQTKDIGGIGFATIEPGTSKEENVSFTSITQNANGTAQLNGVTRGLLPVYPYTASTTLAVQHSGGATVILSNSAAFYNQFNIAANTSTISGNWTFNSSTIPQLSSDTTNAQVAANNYNLVDYGTLASTSIAGAVPASRVNAGIVKIATSSDLANGATTSTYELVAPSEAFASTSKANIVPVTNGSGTLDPSFISSSSPYSVGALTSASTTLNGQVNIASGTFTLGGSTLSSSSLAQAGNYNYYATSSISGVSIPSGATTTVMSIGGLTLGLNDTMTIRMALLNLSGGGTTQAGIYINGNPLCVVSTNGLFTVQVFPLASSSQQFINCVINGYPAGSITGASASTTTFLAESATTTYNLSGTLSVSSTILQNSGGNRTNIMPFMSIQITKAPSTPN